MLKISALSFSFLPSFENTRRYFQGEWPEDNVSLTFHAKSLPSRLGTFRKDLLWGGQGEWPEDTASYIDISVLA